MQIKAVTGLILAASFCSSTHAQPCELFSHGKVYLAPSLLVQQVSANQSRFRGLHPRLSLGYADWSNKYYLAAEIFYIPATLSLSDTRSNGGSSAKISSNVGASLIPGTIIYNEMLAYLRLGLVSSHFSSPNSSKVGIQMGLGLQQKLSAQWALQGEYLYTTYPAVSKIGTPNSNEIGLGFIYYFNN